MAKHGRRRQDHLARRAHSEGYHARSVYKLVDIDRKYGVFSSGLTAVLDLGAAPGSWTQYAVERGASVLAIDLVHMDVAGATCIAGDFTEPEMVARLAEEGPFDLVMSDAAPATTGNKVVDTGRSEALVESILWNLPQWLAPEGFCIAKIFQGGGEQNLRREFQTRFERAHLFRPPAVRKESFETYLVGIGFQGP
jgi:23S rRNA (uridine2552-2'-O)-methyltransferase